MAQILVDNSVLHHAVAIKARWVDTGIKFWGEVPVATGYLGSMEGAHKIKSSKGGDQTRYIAALARAFMNGEHEAHGTDALIFEMLRHRIGQCTGSAYGDTSLFRNVKFTRVHKTLDGFNFSLPIDDPVERMRQHLSRTSHAGFREIYLALGDIKKSEKHSQDSWHLHCALALGMGAFLTVDTQLVGQINSIQDKDLRQKLLEIALLPSELCDRLKISKMNDEDFESLVADIGELPLA